MCSGIVHACRYEKRSEKQWSRCRMRGRRCCALDDSAALESAESVGAQFMHRRKSRTSHLSWFKQYIVKPSNRWVKKCRNEFVIIYCVIQGRWFSTESAALQYRCAHSQFSISGDSQLSMRINLSHRISNADWICNWFLGFDIALSCKDIAKAKYFETAHPHWSPSCPLGYYGSFRSDGGLNDGNGGRFLRLSRRK